MDDIGLDWQKLKHNSEKIGLRDGIEEGRVSNFQKSFDEGYKNGFKNGFELGKLKGQLESPSELENTKRGNCILCKDESIIKKSNQEKEILQWRATESLIASISPEN